MNILYELGNKGESFDIICIDVANGYTEQFSDFIKKVGFPVVIRPSYVLSGAAMRIIYDKDSLNKCLKDAQNISPAHPVVITQFIDTLNIIDTTIVK